MKKTAVRLLCLWAVIVPTTASSQSNIMSAFDAIIKCPQAEITDRHSLMKDRMSNLRTGQDDIYGFVLPSGKIGLVKDVLAAFEKDKDKAYVVKAGRNNEGENEIDLHSEDSVHGGISIDDRGCEYIYEFFTPSKEEDPEGTHRYAYGFNYKEENGKITGKIVINYATTSEYRQEAKRERQLRMLADMGRIEGVASGSDSGQEWFEQMMACLSDINGSKSQKRRIALATKAYGLIKDLDARSYGNVTEQDKRLILNVLKSIKDMPDLSDDHVLHTLLDECEAGLK